MYLQFNIQQFHVLTTQCICVFCVDLTGLYNRDGLCLLRGTDWLFKYNLKGLVTVQAFSCEPLAAMTQVWFQASPCEIFGGIVALDRFITEYFGFLPS